MVEKHGLQTSRCETKGRYPFIFGLLLIPLPSKHNGHLLLNCTFNHFRIPLYRYLKNLPLELSMANGMS